MDLLLSDYQDVWCFDAISAYQERPVYDFSNALIGYARTIQIDNVVSECQRNDTFDADGKPYRFLSARLRTWEVIANVGQGCPILDISVTIKRRHQPTPQGAYQSGKYAAENLRVLISEWFRDGGFLITNPGAFPFSSLDTGCPL